MAIFKKKNQALPYVDGLYPADPAAVISSATFDATNVPLQGEISYNDPQVDLLLHGYVEQTKQPLPQINDGILLMDIAQSHHYTVYLGDSKTDKKGMSMSRQKLPNGIYSEGNGFLPVKTMNLKYTSYENMSIPVAIFGDFPLLNRKRVSTIDLSCYDYDNNKLEYELRQWEAQCFPQGRYVAYMDDIAREFIYRGYNVKGKRTLEYRVFVIPAGNVTVSRDYSANDAKMVNFSLVVVGDGRTCASGEGKKPSVTPIVDHGGAGNGQGGGPFNTLWVSGYKLNYDSHDL